MEATLVCAKFQRNWSCSLIILCAASPGMPLINPLYFGHLE